MTQAEWNACTDPTPMLEFLRGKASDRKLRLFACACCRNVWDNLWGGAASQKAVAVAERYADQSCLPEELDAARSCVVSLLELYPGEPVYDPAYWACGLCLQEDAGWCAFYAANTSTKPYSSPDFDDLATQVRADEERFQAHLLKEILGDLPIRPVLIDPSCLAWNHGTVPKLTQIIYDERAFNRLPLLADALEDAGCTDAAILAHCRERGVHVRGCWVVDLLLGKE